MTLLDTDFLVALLRGSREAAELSRSASQKRGRNIFG